MPKTTNSRTFLTDGYSATSRPVRVQNGFQANPAPTRAAKPSAPPSSFPKNVASGVQKPKAS